MERTTKAHVQSAFSRLAEVCGKRIASSFDDVGAWQLHRGFNSWEIREIVTPGGGIRMPLGERSFSASAFYDACWFAIRAIEAREAGRSVPA